MNAGGNTRLVQRAYEAFGARDGESFLALLDPGVEWQLPAMPHVPFAGTWHGHDGVRQFLRALGDSQDVLDFRPQQFIASGDSVVVLGHVVMRVKASGRESASDWAHVWTLSGGRVTHFREYVDTAAVARSHRPSGA